MSTRHSKENLLALFAAASLVALAGCRQSGRVYGLDTLVVALESSPLHLDPRIGIDQNSWRVHHVVFNGLMKNGAIGDYVPDLAESVTSEDGAVWNVRLRPSVRFHDGRAVTSRDVVYTYQSLLAPSFLSSKKEPLRIIRSIEAPGPLDVVFRLERPYASFPLQLLFGIVPEGTSAEEGERAPIGTGPYRFVSYHADDRVTFERFDGYFGEKAKLEKLVYKIVSPSSTTACRPTSCRRSRRSRPSPSPKAPARPTSTSPSTSTIRWSGERTCVAPSPWLSTATPSRAAFGAIPSRRRIRSFLQGTGLARTTSRLSRGTSPRRGASSTPRAFPIREAAGLASP